LGGLRAVHIIAHGAPGEIGFSAGPLSVETILAHEADLARIGEALGLSGELLVWSCDTGRGWRGDRFLEALCWATGALIAAATGPVGAATRGGRWELNARLGAASVMVPLTVAGIAAYAGVLATKTWNGTTTGNWSSTGSWVGGVVPVSGDDVVIGSSSQNASFIATADLTVSINSLTIHGKVSGSKTTTMTVTSGATVTVGSGGITFDSVSTINGTGTLTVNGTISGGGAINASSGTFVLNGSG